MKKRKRTNKCCPLLVFLSLEWENAYAQLISVFVRVVWGVENDFIDSVTIFLSFEDSGGAWGSEGNEDLPEIFLLANADDDFLLYKSIFHKQLSNSIDDIRTQHKQRISAESLTIQISYIVQRPETISILYSYSFFTRWTLLLLLSMLMTHFIHIMKHNFENE